MSTPPHVILAPVAPGDLLLGRYRVERVLGAGGMGVVVAAMHVELGQRVAVKFLNPNVLDNPDAVERFTREARATVRIKSDHVARVMDVGRLDNGAPYMVMEYLEGEDLAATLQRGPVPIEDAVDYLVQTCDAMAEAHVEGIIHRDLKPANLFLVERTDGSSSVKVLDFGISKLMLPEPGSSNLTRTQTLMGSPLYMSPEQLKSARDVDPRSDVWSLGVILFELLTGRPPFNADTFAELVSTILNDPAPRIVPERPDVPAPLEQAVLRSLEKAPERRFQNVGEFAAAIVEFGSSRSRVTTERVLKVIGKSPSQPPNPPAPSTPPARLEGGVLTAPGDAGTATGWTGGAGRDRRRRGVTLLMAAVGLAGALAWIVRRPSARPSRPEATPTANANAAPETRPVPTTSSNSPLPGALAPRVEAAVATVASSAGSAKGLTAKPRAPRPSASVAPPEVGKKTLTIDLK